MDNNAIDWNLGATVPLQWMYESEPARFQFRRMMHRIDLASQGKATRNLYLEELTSNISKVGDGTQRAEYMKQCQNVPPGQDFSISRAISNRANQMASGVDTYECEVNDPYMLVDDETEDLLNAQCEQDYAESHLGTLSATFSRDLTKYGITAALVKYDEKADKNRISRISPKNIWFDTKYSSTGQERFRGYSTMISWRCLQKIIEKDGDEINTSIKAADRSILDDGKIKEGAKVSKRKIRSLSGLTIYIEDLNKLACSPSLQAGLQDFAEYDHDLMHCYNLGYYRSFANNPEARTKNGYMGDDVELTVMYDLASHIEYKIINRRYVISANSKAFKRTLHYDIKDIDGNDTTTTSQFVIDCPLKFEYAEHENRDMYPFPVSDLYHLLGLHDELCAWRAKRNHVAKILSVLRIETNSTTAASLKGLLNVMGVILEDVQGDINNIQFAYDWTAIDSQIQYLENTIKTTLHAYDDFDAMQAMGDRASAAESGMAAGAIAQGLATHQNAIMELYAEIAQQCLANRVAYSDKDTFRVRNRGSYRPLTIQQMATVAIVNVKSKLSKKIEEKALAVNALTLLGAVRDFASDAAITYLAQQAMYGQMPRAIAAQFFAPEQPSEQMLKNNALDAQNLANMLKQNEQAYQSNPIPYEVDNVMQNSSPEDIDQIIAGVSEPYQGPEIEEEPQGLDMMSQDGALTSGLDVVSPEFGSQAANPNGVIM